ncbi:MAG: hypothetical protein WC523_05640 [Patescibacteria group bacterium]|jgi:hypothetical protein
MKNIESSTSKFREENGVIYFSVTSDGKTGEEWIEYFAKKGYRVGDYVLRSKDFKPTAGITTEVAVLKGVLFEDKNRITKNIRAEAAKRKLLTPNAEVACLIRDKFTNEELKAMDLYCIVTMHDPINDSGVGPLLLHVHRSGDGSWLNADFGEPGSQWGRDNGFAFVVSQV